MPRPTVSLIVPTFNRSKYLALAIESLIAQTHPFDELLIVDDGSTDNTPQVVAQLPGNPKYLRKENGGRAAAINFGVKHAKGDLIWVFDDDDIALPHALATLVAPFLERETDFTYGPWYLCNERTDGSLEIAGTTQGQTSGGRAFFHEMLYRCFTQGNAMLIAKRCYDAVGPLREDLIRSQDHEFMLRLGRRFDAVPVSAPTFYWRRHLGPRGAGAGKMFGVEKLNRNWHIYRQKIFVDVHRDLPLVEYLPFDRQALYPGITREARLTRAVVMACHGLWQLALPEMVEMSGVDNTASLSSHERAELQRLSGLISSDSLIDLALLPNQARHFALLSSTTMGQIFIDQIVRAAYWQFRKHLHDKERASAISVFRALFSGLGFRPVVRAALGRLSHAGTAA